MSYTAVKVNEARMVIEVGGTFNNARECLQAARLKFGKKLGGLMFPQVVKEGERRRDPLVLM